MREHRCTKSALILHIISLPLILIYYIVNTNGHHVNTHNHHANNVFTGSENLKLDNHQICSIGRVLDTGRCYVLCSVRQPGCKSFNYDGKKRECELNNATMEEFPLDAREATGIKYFGVKSDDALAWAPDVTCRISIHPVCGVHECSAFVTENGDVSDRSASFIVGDTQTVTCDVGFRADESTENTCTNINAKYADWQPAPTKCVPECGAFVAPNNGAVADPASSFIDGDKQTITCDTGFRINGSAQIMCINLDEHSAEWEPTANHTMCVPECRAFVTENGDVSDPAPSFIGGDTQTVTCDAGFRANRSTKSTCININAKYADWQPAPTMCVPECGAFAAPNNGAVADSASSFIDGDKQTITCDAGFRVNGSAQILCINVDDNLAEWEPTAYHITCVPECNAFDGPEYGAVSDPASSFIDGDTQTITCDAGFRASGSTEITCTALDANSAEWQPAPESTTCDCVETALGMESGEITVAQITASSVDTNVSGPAFARFNHDTRWLPKTNLTDHWINIDLRKNQTVAGLITQGYGNWVSSIYVKYEQPAGSGQLHYIKDVYGSTKLFDANTAGEDTHVKILFDQLLYTSIVQVEPRKCNNDLNCPMRLEILGCIGS